MGMISEFKDFAMRGNVVDMAVGIVIDFIIIAFAIFMVVKAMNAAKKKEEAAPPPAPPKPTKDQELLTEIRDSLRAKG